MTTQRIRITGDTPDERLRTVARGRSASGRAPNEIPTVPTLRDLAQPTAVELERRRIAETYDR
ncbi:hypothetical protein ACQP06_03000 [Nocardia sp. CA-136227]|uniref:hypothetical protein n=1 Tax=Nocardia sp. CA-136227 TaxID=3239979 RepID=UPI003D976B06